MVMMKHTLLLTFSMLLLNNALAQFNDSINYYVNFTSAGIVNKTNEGSSHNLNNHLRFSISKRRVSMNTSMQWLYGRQLGLSVNNDLTAAVDINLYNRNSRRLYYWGLALYETSLSLKINDRFQGGVGIGHNVVDKPHLVVILSDGVLYEKSDLYQDIEDISQDYETYRNSFRLKFRWVIKERVTLDGSDFLQHSLADKKDYIIKSNTNIAIRLVKWLSFTTSLTYNKITKTERENLLLTFGLTVEKYF